VSDVIVGYWESGRVAELGADKMLTICTLMRVSPEWLMYGRGKFEARDLSFEAREIVEAIITASSAGSLKNNVISTLNGVLNLAGLVHTPVKQALNEDKGARITASFELDSSGQRITSAGADLFAGDTNHAGAIPTKKVANGR
jgi:hypothetical protein